MTFFPGPGEEVPRPNWNPAPPAWPAWRSEPNSLLPGAAPIEVVIGRGADTVVALNGVRAFPSGIAVTIDVRWRPESMDERIIRALHGGPDEPLGRLLWGIEFSDGRKVTNADPYPYPAGPPDAVDGDIYAAEAHLGPPDRPVLTAGDGSGRHGQADQLYWLWPLPPPGNLRVACEWTGRGIRETVTEIDAAPIIEAAGRAQPLWP